jgi:hypothetical protein
MTSATTTSAWSCMRCCSRRRSGRTLSGSRIAGQHVAPLAAAAGSARPPGVGAEADDDGLPVSLEGLPAAHLRVLLDGLPVFER